MASALVAYLSKINYNVYLEDRSAISGDSCSIYFHELTNLVQGMKAQYDIQISASIFAVLEESKLFCDAVFAFYSGLTFSKKEI